jgi:exodeoxyribonuclease III
MLDHVLLSPDLARVLTNGGVSADARAAEGASDHAPAWIEFDYWPNMSGERPGVAA